MPVQTRLKSSERSLARTEKREAYRATTLTIGAAMASPARAPVPHRIRLSARRARRKAAEVPPSAERTANSGSRRTRPGQDQVGDVGTGDHEQQAGSRHEDPQYRARLGVDLVTNPRHIDPVAGGGFVNLRVSGHHRTVDRAQLGARRLEPGPRGEATEHLGHPVLAPGHHRRRQMCAGWSRCWRSARFRPDTHGGLEDSDDHRRARAFVAAEPDRPARTAGSNAASGSRNDR